MCDFIIAADNAKFGQPEVKLGILPGAGGSQRLPHAVSKAKAMDMVLTGRMMDAAEADRRLAGQRFLADYATHFVHGRYVGGSLPRLPFFDNAFDVVLCAHLLFFQAGRFDFEWHMAACRELVRVTAGEVRIQPVCGADGRPHPKLTALRRELAAGGIESEVVRVSYEFAGGSQSMLVLRKEGS
jgi:hypothetical protein